MMINRRLDRRSILRGTAAGALAAGGASLFGACGDGTGSGGEQQTRTEVALPAYVPFTGVAADLPATEDGLQPAFFKYPANPKPLTTEKPIISGDPITAAAIINDVPRPHESNQWWQALEERIGAEIKILGAPTGNFPAKLSTILAGGELPDIAQMYQITHLPGILKSGFADLTEHLSGDAIKDYPALANIPTLSWPAGVYNNGIYGIPQHRTPHKVSLIVREDIASELGVGIEPTNGEEWLEMWRQLTDAKNNHWAGRSPRNILDYVNQMLGTPNTWKVEGGKFTRDYTTDEYRQALDILAKMWKEGLFHPDSFSAKSGQVITWIANGTVRMLSGPGAFFPSARAIKAESPDQTVAVVRPPKWEGGGHAPQYLGPAILCVTALKQAAPERIGELLSLMNYLAAPFGTEEDLFIRYGDEGRHHNRENGEPVMTDDGTAEIFNIGYVMSPPRVHYLANFPDVAELEYRAEESAVTDGVPWPTAGLYSETDETEGVALEKTMSDLEDEIMRGKRTLKDWDDAVASWKNDGGDKIAADYEESLQQTGGS